MRSLLFVPGDSDKKLAKGTESGADALILDLEDSVGQSRKAFARALVSEYVSSASGNPLIFVRINALDAADALSDLASVVGPGLAGVMLPKCSGPQDITRLSYYMDALEARAGVAVPAGIIPVVTETPNALLSLGNFGPGLPRLRAFTWGAEDLSAAVGAYANTDADGTLSPLYQLAGSLCLCASAASGVASIDGVYVDLTDSEGLAVACKQAKRRGFKGKLAVHPRQVPVINEAFSPSSVEIAAAQRIVQAFEGATDAGTLSMDGKMVDRPHLIQAMRTLGEAERLRAYAGIADRAVS